MASKSQNIKAAFRVYSPSDALYLAPYTYSPINQSHAGVNHVRVLGMKDENKCKQGELCPAVNVKVKMGDGEINYFTDTNLVTSFPEDLLHRTIQMCKQLRASKVSAQQFPDLQESIQWCETHIKFAEDKILNPSFNCIGFALGIKVFIPANLYQYDEDLEATQNVRTFLLKVLDVRWSPLFGPKMSLYKR